MARYCVSNNNKTRVALRLNTGNCIHFSNAQIHPHSCCSEWHVMHRHPEWNFRGPLAHNKIIYHHWVQSDFSTAPKYPTSNTIWINTHPFTHLHLHAHRTVSLLAHIQALGQQEPQRGTLVCFLTNPEEMFAALFRLAVI